MTNNTYVNPNLLGTLVQTTLNFPGDTPPNYTPAALVNNAPVLNNQQNFQMQTDANQSFTQSGSGTRDARVDRPGAVRTRLGRAAFEAQVVTGALR